MSSSFALTHSRTCACVRNVYPSSTIDDSMYCGKSTRGKRPDGGARADAAVPIRRAGVARAGAPRAAGGGLHARKTHRQYPPTVAFESSNSEPVTHLTNAINGRR